MAINQYNIVYITFEKNGYLDMKNENQQQIEAQLKELKVDKLTISLILKEYKDNKNKLSIDLRHRIQCYCEHIAPVNDSAYRSLHFSINKKNREFIETIPEQLFKLTSHISHEYVSVLSEFISNQFKRLNQSNREYKNGVLTDVLTVFDKALKINEASQEKQEIVFHILNKLNQEANSNPVVVTDFFLTLDSKELHSRFIKDDKTFNDERINQYIQLYSQYDIQATKSLDILDDLMFSPYYQRAEKLLFKFDDKNRSYIKDLNIFKDNLLVMYLEMGGLDFYQKLKDKNHALNLNRYIASVLPILEVGRKYGELSYVDIAESFGKDLKPFLRNFVDLDVKLPFESDKNQPIPYLQKLNEKIITCIMTDSDKKVAIALAKKNTKIKRNFYWNQTDETQKYKDEVQFFKTMFAKFDSEKENFDAVSQAFLFYEKNVRKNSSVADVKTLRTSILQHLDNYNSGQSNNYSIEEALSITSKYRDAKKGTDMSKKSLQDMEQTVKDIEKEHKNLQSDLNFLKKLKKPR